ncbi:hypothetical protein SteCoe_13750 [Stentor coeruleus]|uniref:Poly A polymerase head domain-containing protein n=1 Tax=Stentor coeruleus TaxID=5963 RepID=A0A1R2C7N5_9CILI|nr:hypothetical protein SteCoe_13750 [Stentor coeruleus]
MIRLTNFEAQLCKDLLEVAKNNNLTTVLRIAGGWVRDKILGLESHDIDITLDNMMGEEFAKLFCQNKDISSLGKVRINPEASKHLETACVRYNGIDLDFVNLRAENYTESSRIPTIKIGTPLDDAMRRDLTINSMFYNINTGEIEDLTGFGLIDLQNKIARTPLDPLNTFLDDPLRVLRTIRFAARFELTILAEVQNAIESKPVYYSLLNKISRERIAKEYYLIIKGKNHMVSLEKLYNSGLFPVIFKIPEGYPNFLQQGYRLVSKIQRSSLDENNLYIYTAGILAFYDKQLTIKKGKKDMHLYEYITTESLKMSNLDNQIVCGILNNLPKCIESFRNFNALEFSEIICELKQHWELCVIVSGYIAFDDPVVAEQQILSLCEVVKRHEIDTCYEDKPLLNGNELKNMLSITGKDIGKYSKECLKWQILNRNGTREELVDYLKKGSLFK